MMNDEILIDKLELSARSKGCLRNMYIHDVGQLVQLTEKDLLKGRNLGRKVLNEIKEVLCDLGLKLRDQTIGEDFMSLSENETGKVERIMICAAKRGYIVTDGANPRVLESPHLIRVFETKDSLLAWLKDNLMEDAAVPDPDNGQG